MRAKLDLLPGTLDVMVLQTLATLGSLHGYGIARRIEQISGDQVLLNQGTIYASLVRLQQRGWIGAGWGISENNRRAKVNQAPGQFGGSRFVELCQEPLHSGAGQPNLFSIENPQ